MKKITILGSTGSIGTQSLEIVIENPDQYEITALTCGRNVSLLSKQIEEFRPSLAVVSREEDGIILQRKHKNTEILWGKEGILSAAKDGDCSLVLNGLMGMRGLEPTYAAIKSGKDVALANKETLVAGGQLIMETVKEMGVHLFPVDSEHSAIFQALQGNKREQLNKILLTASGGPFRGYGLKQLEAVTLAQALKHPNWSMGKKITIDSATMMNKGLEVIEARWLFDVQGEDIQVIIHPESIIHSMVEYVDHGVIAQLGIPDMKVPISYALSYPDRMANQWKALDFYEIGKLTFEKPDLKTFRCLGLAYEALKLGGSYPTVLNGANEVLVDLFLQGKIQFIHIQKTLERILEKHQVVYNFDLQGILEIDRSVREEVEKLVQLGL
ncbi:MAG: 1-deoxy-D-xylulose-5-phosphate reductoisomerase [Anaerovorax sp.]